VEKGYYGRTIVPAMRREQTSIMAKYSSLLGRRVQVQYRAGNVNLPASGTLVADSGKSIFLEERFEKSGVVKTFRWEIPYQFIVRIKEVEMSAPTPPGEVDDARTNEGANEPGGMLFRRRRTA